jgi:GMP synthase-like glutamine amidotransferase
MRIAILETGKPPADLRPAFGTYPAMFAALLGPGFETISYDVEAGELPEGPEAHGAYLITGSPAGVYDPLPWIDAAKRFLLAAKGKAKLVGVCFGHQLMAEAFGGRVEKSERGWGVGLQRYGVRDRQPWMDEAAAISVPVSHQDQIVVQPPETAVVARSDFSPFGMLAWRDQPAISMQFHPEFDPAYAKALIDLRRERLPNPDAALGSLDRPNDRARVGEWIRRFLGA